MQRYLRLLRRRDFALLWGGATVSALGDGMSFVALVWLVLERGGDPGTVGWLAATYTAPVVVGGLIAGVVLDRFDRRLTEQLFVVAGIYGLLFMTSLAGIPSLIPALVDAEDLTTANAMESLTYGIAGLAGPALAGVVIAVFGAPVVLAIDAGTYAAFFVCLVALGPVRSAAEAEDRPTGYSASAESRSGGLGPAIRFVLGAPAILAITVIYMVINVGEGIFLVLAPVYARDVLGGGATTYGTLVSSFAAGSLVGALLVGGIGWRWPLGRSIAAATLATGLVLGLLLATPPLVPSAGILALAGLCASSLTVWAQTIRMRLIPPSLRGRVFALLRTLMQATPPIGALVGGALLAAGGPVPAIAAMAALIAVPGAIGLILPALGSVATGEG